MRDDTFKVLDNIYLNKPPDELLWHMIRDVLDKDLYKYADYETREMYFQATEAQFKDFAHDKIEFRDFYVDDDDRQQQLANLAFIATKYDIDVPGLETDIHIYRCRLADMDFEKKVYTTSVHMFFASILFLSSWKLYDLFFS